MSGTKEKIAKYINAIKDLFLFLNESFLKLHAVNINNTPTSENPHINIGIGKESDLYPSGFAKINEITHGIKYLKSFSKRSETLAIRVKATKEE